MFGLLIGCVGFVLCHVEDSVGAEGAEGAVSDAKAVKMVSNGNARPVSDETAVKMEPAGADGDDDSRCGTRLVQ